RDVWECEQRFEHLERLVVATQLDQADRCVLRGRPGRDELAGLEELGERRLPRLLVEQHDALFEVAARLFFLLLVARRRFGGRRRLALRRRDARQRKHEENDREPSSQGGGSLHETNGAPASCRLTTRRDRR